MKSIAYVRRAAGRRIMPNVREVFPVPPEGGDVPPVLVTDPVIENFQPQVGIVHTYAAGSWTGASTVTAQWTLDGVAVQSAATPYTPLTADAGKVLGVTETATAADGAFATASTQQRQVLPA